MELNEYKTEQEKQLKHEALISRAEEILRMPIETPEQRIAYVKAALESTKELLTSPL